MTGVIDLSWVAAILAPALLVLTVHGIILGVWRRIDLHRVRTQVRSALLRADLDGLRAAKARVSEAGRHWPGPGLWAAGQALEIVLRRARHAGGQIR